MNDTEADISLKVTVVKLTGQNEEDVEIAWGKIDVDKMEYAYANEGIMPKSFPVTLNNATGAGGEIKVSIRFSKELLEEQKEKEAAGDLAKKKPGQDTATLEA